jgi:hypothetical protein
MKMKTLSTSVCPLVVTNVFGHILPNKVVHYACFKNPDEVELMEARYTGCQLCLLRQEVISKAGCKNWGTCKEAKAKQSGIPARWAGWKNCAQKAAAQCYQVSTHSCHDRALSFSPAFLQFVHATETLFISCSIASPPIP